MNHDNRSQSAHDGGLKQAIARTVVKINSLQRKAEKKRANNNNSNPREDALARYTLGLFIATCVIAVAAVLAFGAALLQWNALNSTDRAIHDQLVEIKKQSSAIERQSFAGRAYLFPRYVFNPAGIEQRTESLTRVPITYCVDNLGPTPAIITNIDAHLFLAGRSEIFDSSDIDQPRIASRRESYVTPTVTPDSSFFDFSRHMPATINVPGNAKFCTFTTTFGYLNGTGKDAPTVSGSLFYLVVTYKDIFGALDRHTWYQVGLGGTGAEPGNPKYNHWD